MVKNTFKIAMRTIFTNTLRSLLTMLGIIIGVMAVVILVSIGQGASSKVTDTISSLGTNILTAAITDEELYLERETLDELKEYDAVEEVAPYISSSVTLRSGSNYSNTTLIGATMEYMDINDIEVQSGRMLMESDNEWRTPVVLLGTEVAEDIFESYDVVGEKVTIGTQSFTVIGLLDEGGSSLSASNDNRVIVPYQTAQRMIGQTKINTFYLTAAQNVDIARTKNIVEMFLLAQTRDEEAYTVLNQSEIADAMSDVTDTLSLMLGGIAAISLLVGGIGIMNIMLVSVSERTREIGIRKAIGAKRKHILAQFLVEACVLSVMGGICGVLFSYIGVGIFNIISGMSISVSTGICGLAIAFCAVIGIAFGGYPAAKASKLVPIEALRYS